MRSASWRRLRLTSLVQFHLQIGLANAILVPALTDCQSQLVRSTWSVFSANACT
jgi:hypothetical protein